MPTFRHLLMSLRPGLALVLALLVTAASFCPRGWFVCLHDGTASLVGMDHVSEHHCDECPIGHDDGCLDLALSLIGDLQVHQLTFAPVLPVGNVLTCLPHLAQHARTRPLPPPAWTLEPPPTPLVQHVCLLV